MYIILFYIILLVAIYSFKEVLMSHVLGPLFGYVHLTFLAKVIFYICVTLLGVLVINVLFKNGVCCAFNKLYNKWRFKCLRK